MRTSSVVSSSREVMEVDWNDYSYKFVDIMEYEIELEARRCIEDFCIQFFKDWDCYSSTTSLVLTCQQVVKDKRLHKVTQDLSQYLTLDNFNGKFSEMCIMLFPEDTSAKDEHIVSLLAFCIELDGCLQNCSWYSPRLLISCLIDALARIDFNPIAFNWTQSRSDIVECILSSFLVIIPPLMLFYLLQW